MNITKYIHSCLLVETPERVAVFDPGVMSYEAFDFSKLVKLDDIFITHSHSDHVYEPFLKDLIDKFPRVRVTSTSEVVDQLRAKGFSAQTEPPTGVIFFDAPHESLAPLSVQPEEIGIHYLDVLTNPGDSHSFNETKAILALPITAPWGSAIKALNLALELKPKYVIPIHDWHWHEQARRQMYDSYADVLSEHGITMLKPETGQPISLDV
jgi:L-ascorbate metabolism protein UlaG (beta-lactamase superfamily)